MSAGFFYTGTIDIDTKYNKANKNTNSDTNFFIYRNGSYVDIGKVYTLLSDYPASDWNRTAGGNCNFLSGTTDIGSTFIEGGVTRKVPSATGDYVIELEISGKFKAFKFNGTGVMTIPEGYNYDIMVVNGGQGGSAYVGGGGGFVSVYKNLNSAAVIDITIGGGGGSTIGKIGSTDTYVSERIYSGSFVRNNLGNGDYTETTNTKGPGTTVFYSSFNGTTVFLGGGGPGSGGGSGAGGHGNNGTYITYPNPVIGIVGNAGAGGIGYTYTNPILSKNGITYPAYGGGGGGSVTNGFQYDTVGSGQNGGGYGGNKNNNNAQLNSYPQNGEANTGGGGGAGVNANNTGSSGGSGAFLVFFY